MALAAAISAICVVAGARGATPNAAIRVSRRAPRGPAKVQTQRRQEGFEGRIRSSSGQRQGEQKG